ncbi:MAG: sigma-70 family RNA polymerase sigma factor [Planctomycetes bacterium]|nr:sigma-70 family RNA polymerase sigma factor [Planctomycetota bacterium]
MHNDDTPLTQQQTPSEEFMRALTDSQPRLQAFILSLLPDPEAAQDVLQATNLVAWRSAGQFVPGTSFLAWAFQIARHKVLAHVRDRKRDRHIYDEALIDQLATEGVEHGEQTDQLLIYLEECLSLQPRDLRKLLRERYAPQASVQKLAQARGVTPGNLSVMLSRVRQALLMCVQQKLAKEGAQ